MKSTILLVDDQSNWYQVVRFILEDEGYDIIWVRTRAEGLKKLTNGLNVDLVMVNLNLKPEGPILDSTGYLMLEDLHRRWPESPLVVLAAVQEPQRVSELYYKYKVDYVALKVPEGEAFDAPTFVRQVNELVRNASLAKKRAEVPSKKVVCQREKLSVILDQHAGNADVRRLQQALRTEFPSENALVSYDNLRGDTKWHKVDYILELAETYGSVCTVCDVMLDLKPDDKSLREELSNFCIEKRIRHDDQSR